MIRRVLSAVLDWLTPAPLDLGFPEPTRVPSRACGACGHTPTDESERVVGVCVPGYHEYALVGWPEPTTVRECHSDDTLAVLTDEDWFGLTAAMDLAPSRPHESTADERMRRVR